MILQSTAFFSWSEKSSRWVRSCSQFLDFLLTPAEKTMWNCKENTVPSKFSQLLRVAKVQSRHDFPRFPFNVLRWLVNVIFIFRFGFSIANLFCKQKIVVSSCTFKGALKNQSRDWINYAVESSLLNPANGCCLSWWTPCLVFGSRKEYASSPNHL